MPDNVHAPKDKLCATPLVAEDSSCYHAPTNLPGNVILAGYAETGTRPNMSKPRILVDLKPALDGFAGIPQESRLLYNNLLHLQDEFDVDGLLQHGTGVYPPLPQKNVDKPDNEAIINDSSFLSVLGTGLEKTYIPRAPQWVQQRIHRQMMIWQAFTSKPLQMGMLQTSHFDDLIWRTLFSKALPTTDKELVCRSKFRTLEPSRQHMYNIMLGGLRLFPANQYMHVDTSEYDILITQLPFPGKVSRNTSLIIRYHDAVPVFMPHTIGDQHAHRSMHYHALKSNVADGAWFACVSEASRQDLLTLFPEAEERAVVIHNTIPAAFSPSQESKTAAWDIIASHLSQEHDKVAHDSIAAIRAAKKTGADFLLMVSTLEPRKNHTLLLNAFDQFRRNTQSDTKLILVGGTGWHFEPILGQMRPGLANGNIFHLANVPTIDLAILYQHASATVCPSLAEGFDYSGIEAMRCGGLVLASKIPVHTEIFGESATYFDPYSTVDAAEKLVMLLSEGQEKKRTMLRKKGRIHSENYTADKLRPQWQEFLHTII